MISIDFWNTIVIATSNGELRQKARLAGLKKYAAKHGRELHESMISEAHRYASQKFDEIWLGSHRTPTSAELVDYTLQYLDLSLSSSERKELTQIYQESLLEGPPELTPGVGESLEKLASRNKLAIISDTMFSPGTILRDYLRSKKLDRFFTAYAFSDEVGVSKPHKKMYKKVLAETGSSPETSWHIGDIHQTDIMGAQAIGMKAVLYTGINNSDAGTTTADIISENWAEIPGQLIK